MPGDPDFRVDRIIEDDAVLPDVTIADESGRTFRLDRRYAATICVAPLTVHF